MLTHSDKLVLALLALLGYTGCMIWLFLHFLRVFRRKELIQQRLALETKFQAEKNLYEAKQEIQEETFKQISRELHDNVGQTFSLAKLGLAHVEEMDDVSEVKVAILETAEILGKGIADLRDISRSIKAELVRTTGLRAAIENQLGFLERTGRYQVVFECDSGIRQTDPATEVIFYRILQESLNNIIRHSKATEIHVYLSTHEKKTKLRVKDNGVGFEAGSRMSDDARPGGLMNMQVRAKTIGANCWVESKPGCGTTVTITSNQAHEYSSKTQD